MIYDLRSVLMVVVTSINHSTDVSSDFAKSSSTVALSSLALHALKRLRKHYRLVSFEIAFKGSFLSDSSPALSGCSFNAFNISHERP